MKLLFKNQRFYFLLLAVFVAAGGFYTFLSEKADLILFFSERRSWLGDHFFRCATKLGEEHAYFVVGILCFAIRLRYSLLVTVLGFTVLGASHALKEWFSEDRPYTFFRKNNLLEGLQLVSGIEPNTGATSFPSGHTMSAFALFSLLVFLLPNKKSYAAGFFLLALMVGFSRVYLVQHFWEDVYAGAIIGVLIALIFYSVHARQVEKWSGGWLDKPLIKIGKAKSG